jgi:hypothetical protein
MGINKTEARGGKCGASSLLRVHYNRSTCLETKLTCISDRTCNSTFVLIKFAEILLKLTELFLQVRSAIQETLHLFRPHLHSHEVQVEVSTGTMTATVLIEELQFPL